MLTQKNILVHSSTYHKIVKFYLLITIIGVALAHAYTEHAYQQKTIDQKTSYIELESFNYKINFGGIESSLARIKLDSTQKLHLNAAAESALSIATSRLPENTDSETLNRISFLIQQSFNGSYGKQLSHLFILFYQFKSAERDLLSNAKHIVTLEDELSSINHREKLQLRYLGDDFTKQLYGKQNTLARMLIEMRALESSNEISKEKKESQQKNINNRIERLMQDLN